MQEFVLPCLYAFFGSCGFCFLFNVRGADVFLSGLCGMLSWLVYLLFGGMFETDIMQYLFAAAALGLQAEILARLRKVPVTLYLIIGMVPLVPGARIFYTMEDFLRGENASFLSNLLYTVKIGGAIAVGLVVSKLVFNLIISKLIKKRPV